MAKRIKILYTIPNFDTAGSGKVVFDLVKRIDKTVFDPEICCFHNKGKFFKEVEKLGIKIHLFRFATSYRPLITFPFRVLNIYRFFKRNHFDVIHSWHWSSDISEPLAAKLARIPFVYTKKAMGWGNRSWLWRSKLSTNIIAINNDMMWQFFSKMKYKTTQIPLGVDIDFFRPLQKSYCTPDGMKLKKTDFVIVSIANLVPVKGIEILLKAVQQLEDKSIKVFIIGDDKNEYAQELKLRFIDEAIYFIGKQLDIRPYLALADVFVIPTKDEGRKEGMPIAPLEAMASQRIVLGSKVSGIKDILKEFPECLFRADDVTDLVGKIEYVKGLSLKERVLIANSMRVYIEKKLSLEECINNHDKFYRSVIK